MNRDKLPLWARLARRGFDRRGFIQNAASVGAGLMVGSEMVPTASAQEAAHRSASQGLPRDTSVSAIATEARRPDTRLILAHDLAETRSGRR